MSLKNGKEYLESLGQLGLEAHVMGQKQGGLGEHGLVKPSQKAVAFTFDAAHDPQPPKSCSAWSPPCATR